MSDRAIRFTIEPEGPFSLQEAILFGFGQRAESTFDGVMRLAFCLDGYRTQVGVEVRQDEGGVHCRASDSSDVESVRRQVARVLSLDVDANDFMRIGEADRVIGRLQRAAPGVTSAAVLLPVRGGSGV
jgi:DNA-3-methyladenine glycosylase II